MAPSESVPVKRPGDVLEKPFVKRSEPKKIRRRYKTKPVDPTSPQGVMEYEIKEILDQNGLKKSDILNDMKKILNDSETELAHHTTVDNVKILRLTSSGEGLALIDHPAIPGKKQIVVVPFSLPDDIVSIKIFRSHPLYVEADLLKIESSSELRDNDLIGCRYFGKCSGCQYQNVEYTNSLVLKQNLIKKAYRFFAPRLVESGRLPAVLGTEPSPLQYNYRTKLTPHFSVPNSVLKGKKVLAWRPPMGFGAKGRPTWRETAGGSDSTVDIEECAIGTPILNIGMANERRKFETEFLNYKKGATVLLRENSRMNEALAADEALAETAARVASTFDSAMESVDSTGSVSFLTEKDQIKTCVTDSRYIVNEYVNGYRFQFSAGEFFQNNNSILPIVTDYVKSNLFIAPESQGEGKEGSRDNYLVDAYCGSGLFSITCSKNVKKVIGVEVSADSVKFARLNAKENNIENASFIVGKAEEIFKDIDLPANQTSIILDPPRKGCDDVFLTQLAEFNPNRIIYISCNVHSQARDLEWFMNETSNGSQYEIVSVKGFDFFPQTHHVESVAILRKKVTTI